MVVWALTEQEGFRVCQMQGHSQKELWGYRDRSPNYIINKFNTARSSGAAEMIGFGSESLVWLQSECWKGKQSSGAGGSTHMAVGEEASVSHWLLGGLSPSHAGLSPGVFTRY